MLSLRSENPVSRRRSLLLWTISIAMVVAVTEIGAQGSPDRWRLNTTKNPMNDKAVVSAILRAENPIRSIVGAVTPELVVRCQTRLEADLAQKAAAVSPWVPLQPGLDLYIVTGVPAEVENAEGLHSTWVRFDDRPATRQNARQSTDNQALMFSASFATDVVVFRKSLSESQKMLVQFTPFNSNPVVLQFNVSGFGKHLPKILAACPAVDQSKWK